MRPSVIISPDLELARDLNAILDELGQTGGVRVVENYPSEGDLARLLRAQAPDVIFINVASIDRSAEIARLVEQEVPGVQLIAIHRGVDPQVLLETMRAGIREFLPSPFVRQVVRESLERVYVLLGKRPPAHKSSDQVFSFLPSKAGVGTSTIAANTAAAFAKMPGHNALLSDFDLNSGMLRFMLKLSNKNCVTDAADHSASMDESVWASLVTRFDRLDVLHAGKLNPSARIHGSQIHDLIGFMRRSYAALFFDLSGNLERYSLDIMQESRKIFLVCTPEIPSLHLAREKYQFLKGLDLSDRICVLLNRAQKRPLLSPAQIEEIIGVPVQMSFPNDYHGVNHALAQGKFVEPSTELGRQFGKLAQTLTDRKPTAKPADGKKRFIEYFSLSPSYKLADGKKAR